MSGVDLPPCLGGMDGRHVDERIHLAEPIHTSSHRSRAGCGIGNIGGDIDQTLRARGGVQSGCGNGVQIHRANPVALGQQEFDAG